MKFGLQLVPAWSNNAGIENVSRFLLECAIEADKAGWGGFFLWDHLFFPWQIIPIPDSWTVLTAAAANTSMIKLGTNVTPLPRRRPQVIARQLATIDHISRGRVILGAGLGGTGQGSDAGEEFTSFGEESRYRVLAEMCDEALDIITRLWSGEPVNYYGKHYTVDNVTFKPTPDQKPRIPIWIGAIRDKALERTARYDGWITMGPCSSVGDPGLNFKQVHEKMNKINQYRESDRAFDLVYAFEFPDSYQEMTAFIEEAEEVGITWMLDLVSGMRFNAKQALKHIREGPPKPRT